MHPDIQPGDLNNAQGMRGFSLVLNNGAILEGIDRAQLLASPRGRRRADFHDGMASGQIIIHSHKDLVRMMAVFRWHEKFN